MPHDPVNEEKKPYTLEEFIKVFKEDIDEYYAAFGPGATAVVKGKEVKIGMNAFHKVPHTYDEWKASVVRWLSLGW